MGNEAGFSAHRMRPAFADDLALTLGEAWASLDRGVRKRRSPFHTPAVATIGLDGRPRLRTVVLRAADADRRLLRFHTDIRGEKVAEIRREDRVALHAYDPGAKFQVRVEGRAGIHADDALADNAWEFSKLMSRACYGTQFRPGVPIERAEDFAIPSEEEEISAGRENFSVVLVRVERIETLYLARAGHRRAVFELGETVKARWLAP
jgi:pyridoxamine 5'-phosphate oxidase